MTRARIRRRGGPSRRNAPSPIFFILLGIGILLLIWAGITIATRQVKLETPATQTSK